MTVVDDGDLAMRAGAEPGTCDRRTLEAPVGHRLLLRTETGRLRSTASASCDIESAVSVVSGGLPPAYGP